MPDLHDDDPRHGKTNGYGNLGCRSARCREVHRLHHLAYMNRVRSEGRVLGAHGSALAYDTGCRCTVYRDAHKLKSLVYKKFKRS